MDNSNDHPRPIAVVTGSRADFGLLTPVMHAIAAHPKLQLQTVVTGTHLSAGTIDDVKAAGFAIDAKVTMQKKVRTGRQADAAALGRGVVGLTEAFAQLRPRWVVVLGDRIEALAAASTCAVMGVRLAHLHGGDLAEGVADDAMRHAVSKLAHLHLPATKQSAARLKRMGEPAERIHVVGSPAIDGLDEITPCPGAPDLIVMHHPTGRDDATERRWARAVLAATANKPRKVFLPNHDPGRPGILSAIQELVDPSQVIEHLPRPDFLRMLKGAKCIVGNSSAGLIEAAALRTPCVNVGDRQAGRERPRSVIDTPPSKRRIVGGLIQASQLDLRRMRSPYGDGHTGPRIAELLADRSLDKLPIHKRNAY
ncbi:MAG: UDP-N-acetylglucosamine 2-epimerase [Planctomycetota bacterium]